jgi:hypothetical protein
MLAITAPEPLAASRLRQIGRVLMTEQAVTMVDPGLEVISRYLAAMDRFDIDEILDCFSADVEYGHPRVSEFDPSAANGILIGREKLRAFLEYRGQEDSKHHVTAFARGEMVPGPLGDLRGGTYCFAAGTGRNLDRLVSFCTIFPLDDDNRIRRYSPHVASPYYNLQISNDYASRYVPGR